LGVLALACVMRSILCNRSYMLEEAYFTPNFFPTCTISSRAVHNDDSNTHLSGPATRSVRSCLSCSGVSLHDAPGAVLSYMPLSPNATTTLFGRTRCARPCLVVYAAKAVPYSPSRPVAHGKYVVSRLHVGTS